VLVAGDTFDREGLSDEVLRSAMARFASAAGLSWHVLPGNHDADRPGGLFERLQRLGVPDNVSVHREAAPAALGHGAVLLPAPLRSKRVTADPTAWMDDAVTPEGSIRIGLAHGATQGFGSLGEAAVPIDPARRSRARLAYLALGDWHGTKEIAPGVWYSGTPEPDQFATNDPGGALIVRCDGPRHADVRRVETAERVWLKRTLVVHAPDDLDPLGREVADLGPRASRTLLELTLSGTLTLAARAAVDGMLDQLSAQLCHMSRRLEALGTRADSDDAAAFNDRQLARVATRLAKQAEDATDPNADIAAEALRILYGLARQSREARP
jgi:DNA repair exonuclease SbcCD nuclease subunit